MKRAGTATLERIAPLLQELRAHRVLHEGRPGHFYLRSREVLQAELLGRIDDCLTTIESRATDRSRRRSRGQSRLTRDRR